MPLGQVGYLACPLKEWKREGEGVVESMWLRGRGREMNLARG